MNTPTTPGYYWVQFYGPDSEWELVRLKDDLGAVEEFGFEYPVLVDQVSKWGPKIELPQEDDAEHLQNYIDPLRDPDRLWNV